MKHILNFLFFCFSSYGIELIGEKITFGNTVQIQGNLFSQGPLVIESATLFQTITLNGSVNITACTIGNTQEQTYLFVYGLKENLTPAFFLMIDPLTANLYKKQLTTTRQTLTDTNTFKTVLTNNISSNNNDVLKIENTNYSNKKINILFNASNLIIEGKTIFLNNLSSPSETIHLENDTSSINTINCNSLTGNDITTQTVTTILPTTWNARQKTSINILTAAEVTCAAKEIMMNAIIKTNGLIIHSLPASKIQALYLTLNNGFISTAPPNTGLDDYKIITVNVGKQNEYNTDFTLNCDNWFNRLSLTGQTEQLKFKAKKVIIDEMNLSDSFIKFALQYYGGAEGSRILSNCYITATNLISLEENNTLSIANVTTRNIPNFQNIIKITGTTTIDTPNIFFSALKPLSSFTEYLVVYDNTFNIGGNVGCFSRPSMPSSNDFKEYKTISSLKELKQSDLLKSNQENLFFLILLKIKNLYKQIKASKNQQEKNSELLLKKIKKYTQLSTKHHNLCAKIKKKIKEIEKKIEKIIPEDRLNEILEKLIRLNFETNMDAIYE